MGKNSLNIQCYRSDSLDVMKGMSLYSDSALEKGCPELRKTYEILHKVFPFLAVENQTDSPNFVQDQEYLKGLEKYRVLPLPSFRSWEGISKLFSKTSIQVTIKEELDSALQWINEFASSAVSISPERKALIIYQILSEIVAFFLMCNEPSLYEGIQLRLPVATEEGYVFKNCRLKKEIGLEEDGACAFIFTPEDTYGSSIILFHPTMALPHARGVRSTIFADLHPFGVGHNLIQGFQKRLVPVIEQEVQSTGHRTVVIGHSLGGVLSIHFCMANPYLVHQVHAFCPPKPHPSAKEIWNLWNKIDHLRHLRSEKSGEDSEIENAFQQLRRLGCNRFTPGQQPQIYSWINTGKESIDLVGYFGGSWVGKVYSLKSKELDGLIMLHMGVNSTHPTMTIHKMQISREISQLERVWHVVQRIVASILYGVVISIYSIGVLANLGFRKFTHFLVSCPLKNKRSNPNKDNDV